MKPNHSLAFAAALIAAVALGACNKLGSHNDSARVSMATDPSAQLIGTKPADPTKEPPGVTPVVNDDTSQIKPQTGPKEGDENSHMTNAPGQQAPKAKPEASQ
jgi:hypothetical protein